MLFDDVEVLDFAGPFEVFSRTRLVPGLESRKSEETAPFVVSTVAESPRLVTAIGGLEVKPRFTFRDVPSIDLLVIPGGWGTRRLLGHEPVLQWIRDAAARANVVTSVCSGALLLAQAGLLRGRRATTHWGALDALAALDGSIEVQREARVVHDGVITSAGVSAGIDMSLSVVELLHGAAVADDAARYLDYARPLAR